MKICLSPSFPIFPAFLLSLSPPLPPSPPPPSPQIILLCEAHQFKVAVNGVHQLVYRHRVQDLTRITDLEIQGDVQLLDVKLW